MGLGAVEPRTAVGRAASCGARGVQNAYVLVSCEYPLVADGEGTLSPQRADRAADGAV
jgi:hypothetical protein